MEGVRAPSTATAIAWAAGLFEGEGCFNAYRRQRPSGKWQVQARLRMTDRDIVDRFSLVVRCGSVRGPILDERPHHKSTWEWYAQDALNVRAVIALLLPWLGERRRAKALEVDAVAAIIRPHNAKTTHCPQGHELAGDNLKLEPIKRAGREYLARRCRTCRTAQDRERRRRNTAKVLDPAGFRVLVTL